MGRPWCVFGNGGHDHADIVKKMSYCKEAFLDLSRWTSSPSTIFTKKLFFFQSMNAIYSSNDAVRHCVSPIAEKTAFFPLHFPLGNLREDPMISLPPSISLVLFSLSLRGQTGAQTRRASVYSTTNPWQRNPYEFPTFAKSTSLN